MTRTSLISSPSRTMDRVVLDTTGHLGFRDHCCRRDGSRDVKTYRTLYVEVLLRHPHCRLDLHDRCNRHSSRRSSQYPRRGPQAVQICYFASDVVVVVHVNVL